MKCVRGRVYTYTFLSYYTQFAVLRFSSKVSIFLFNFSMMATQIYISRSCCKGDTTQKQRTTLQQFVRWKYTMWKVQECQSFLDVSMKLVPGEGMVISTFYLFHSFTIVGKGTFWQSKYINERLCGNVSLFFVYHPHNEGLVYILMLFEF